MCNGKHQANNEEDGVSDYLFTERGRLNGKQQKTGWEN
jgi:hypothetical protein